MLFFPRRFSPQRRVCCPQWRPARLCPPPAWPPRCPCPSSPTRSFARHRWGETLRRRDSNHSITILRHERDLQIPQWRYDASLPALLEPSRPSKRLSHWQNSRERQLTSEKTTRRSLKNTNGRLDFINESDEAIYHGINLLFSFKALIILFIYFTLLNNKKQDSTTANNHNSWIMLWDLSNKTFYSSANKLEFNKK